jgi:hypothetical protein
VTDTARDPEEATERDKERDAERDAEMERERERERGRERERERKRERQTDREREREGDTDKPTAQPKQKPFQTTLPQLNTSMNKRWGQDGVTMRGPSSALTFGPLCLHFPYSLGGSMNYFTKCPTKQQNNFKQQSAAMNHKTNKM